jgi:hypothetical protein
VEEIKKVTSKVPSGVTVPQNHFSPPSSGFRIRSLSSPATIRNVPGSGCALAEAAVPLRRWQRSQWL